MRVPSPVFHPYLDIMCNSESKSKYVIGVGDCLSNGWIDGKVFIKDSERLKVPNKDRLPNVTQDWKEFLRECGLENVNCDSNAQSSNIQDSYKQNQRQDHDS